MGTKLRITAGIVASASAIAFMVPVGGASAHDNGSNCSSSRHHDNNDLSCLTAAQATAVKQARATYVARATAIMNALKSDLKPDRERFKNEVSAELAAKEAAKSALMTSLHDNADPATIADLKAKYDAANAAYDAAARMAYAKYKAQVTEATAEAKVDLAQAVVVYTKAINAAFAPDAPPDGLLTVPGGRFDYETFTPGWFGFHGDDHGHHH
jgi:hypothetical protein